MHCVNLKVLDLRGNCESKQQMSTYVIEFFIITSESIITMPSSVQPLIEELRGGFLSLFLLEVIEQAERKSSPSGEGLLHAPLVLAELDRLNEGKGAFATSVGAGVYYARLKLLERLGLIEPRPVLNRAANKAVKAFVITVEGRRAQRLLMDELSRLQQLVGAIPHSDIKG